MSVRNTTGWRRFLTLEPALVRGAIGAVAALALVWGIDITDATNKLDDSITIIFAAIPPLIAWWTRSKVTPYASVAAKEDPVTGAIVAGPVSSRENGTPVSVV